MRFDGSRVLLKEGGKAREEFRGAAQVWVVLFNVRRRRRSPGLAFASQFASFGTRQPPTADLPDLCQLIAQANQPAGKNE